MGCIVQFVFVVGLFELVTKVNQFVFVVDGRIFCFTWYDHFNFYSVHFMLGCTDQVLIRHCRTCDIRKIHPNKLLAKNEFQFFFQNFGSLLSSPNSPKPFPSNLCPDTRI